MDAGERVYPMDVYLSLMRSFLAMAGFIPILAFTQDYVQQRPVGPPRGMEWNIGLGLGIDYGGIGAQVQCRPAPPLVMFAGGGYAFAGFAYNVGAQGRILPDAKWCPFVAAMYGYNAVIVVKGADQYNGIYYGPSVGLGVENHRRDNARNFWRFELILPFRPQEFQDDIDALKKNPSIEVRSEPPPFSFSIAYHFGV